MTIILKTLFILLSFSMLSCSQQSSTDSQISPSSDYLTGSLNLTGSSTIAPLAAELARNFEIRHPDVRIDVQTGGSSRGIADTRQKLSDIGMVSRALKPTEADIKGQLLAKDGVSIIVHKNNPIKSLTNQEIIDIYTGKLNNWQKLTGENKSITVIHKAEGRSTLEIFLKYFSLKNRQVKPGIIIGDNEQGIKLVSKNPYAIAYVSVGTAEYDIKAGISIKSLPLDGIAASTKNIVNGTFPLSRELNLTTKGEISHLAQKFIDYTQTADAKKVIEDFGFVAPN